VCVCVSVCPPIPRWCPVRAWLFFTLLPTYLLPNRRRQCSCPLVQQRWALRRVKNECARRAEGGALALLPKLAVVGASAIGSATLSVKATMSGQEGRQSGDGVDGGEVGGERGETRGATAARSEQRALVRDSRCCPAWRASRARARQPLPLRFSRPWAGVEGLGSVCRTRCVGCGSVVRCVSHLRWGAYAPANLASSPTQAGAL